MEIVNSRALLVTTKTPSKITQVIQKSQVVAQSGDVSQVLVKWDLVNTYLLRNLGFKKAPSPILENYNWPGIYKPFEHQRDTAAFLTLHRRAFCFNEQGTGKTNLSSVLSPSWTVHGEVISLRQQCTVESA